MGLWYRLEEREWGTSAMMIRQSPRRPAPLPRRPKDKPIATMAPTLSTVDTPPASEYGVSVSCEWP